ncbi:MAG: prolyl oligopeptidase family serine peptidase [Acidobacteriaceae bacterium]
MSFTATLLLAALATPGSIARPVTLGTSASFTTSGYFGSSGSLASAGFRAFDPKAFTLQQVLSAPYATSLTASPAGNLLAWVEDSEGRHNLWISGSDADSHAQPPRQLTHNTQDDAQDIGQLAWSPDASSIAYTYGAEYGANGQPANPAHLQRPTPIQVILQPLAPNTQPIIIGDGHSPLFTPDGHHLLFVRAGQVWIANTAAPIDAHELVYDRGSASALTLSPDGHLLAFVSRRHEANQPSHSFIALYILEAGSNPLGAAANLEPHTLHFLAPSTSDDTAPSFSPDGTRIAWLRSPFIEPREFAAARTSPNPWSIQLFDLASDDAIANNTSRTLFTAAANQPGSVLPHLATGEPHLFFPTDNTIDFYSEADSWVHLYQLHIEGDPCVEWLTPGNFEVEDATLSADHHSLLYSSNQVTNDPLDQDRRHLWRIDLTQPDATPVELTHGAGIETQPASTLTGTVAALVSDTRTPMHPAIIATSGQITALRPNAIPATYPAAALVTPKQVLFTTVDGLHLHGQLFTPDTPAPAHAKRAAIIFFHGGPNRQMLLGFPAMDYYSNAYAMNQYLTAQGFVVLSVNYRCGVGYGLDFRECKNAGADGATEYNDVLAANKYLRSLPNIDPKRIGVWGGSYGGYLTALALARNSDLFAAGVDFHGVHDWNFEDNADDWKLGSGEQQSNFAQQDAIAAKARASSPFGSIDHWRSPVLLIHGDNDPDVAYAQTPILAQALRARDVPVQELIFPDEVHGFLLHRDWLTAYQAEAAFFIKTLDPSGLQPPAALHPVKETPRCQPKASHPSPK